jgi:hypothetical protein
VQTNSTRRVRRDTSCPTLLTVIPEPISLRCPYGHSQGGLFPVRRNGQPPQIPIRHLTESEEHTPLFAGANK